MCDTMSNVQVKIANETGTSAGMILMQTANHIPDVRKTDRYAHETFDLPEGTMFVVLGGPNSDADHMRHSKVYKATKGLELLMNADFEVIPNDDE